MCGIAGIISDKKTTFNKNHFNTLGTLNDERGGDSCGIFIDHKVEYGIEKTAMFRNFTFPIKYPKEARIAILHCRKASLGYAVNQAQAQPVIIRGDDGNIEFVLMHNGSITNASQLATKYIPDFSTFNVSDSQIIANIIYNCGFDVLEEYIGTAVFVIIDYRSGKPETFIFKGSSCYNDTGNKSERPLYYMVENGCFYFSSMYVSLHCINADKPIYDFPINSLCKIYNNKPYLVEKFDRSKLVKKVVTYNKSYDVYSSLSFNSVKNIYEVDNKPAHGVYNAYASGYLVNTLYNSTGDLYYFFNGRLLYNKKCFDFLKDISDLFDDSVLEKDCPEIVDLVSYQPYLLNNKYCYVNSDLLYKNITDRTWVTLFTSCNIYSIENSELTKQYIYPAGASDQFFKDVQSIKFDFNKLEEISYLYISSKLSNQYAE